MTREELNSANGCLLQLDMLKDYMSYWVNSRVQYELKTKPFLLDLLRDQQSLMGMMPDAEITYRVPASFEVLSEMARKLSCKEMKYFCYKMRNSAVNFF